MVCAFSFSSKSSHKNFTLSEVMIKKLLVLQCAWNHLKTRSYSRWLYILVPKLQSWLLVQVSTHLSSVKNLYVQDGAVGSSPICDAKVRVIADNPSAILSLSSILWKLPSRAISHDTCPLTIYVASSIKYVLRSVYWYFVFALLFSFMGQGSEKSQNRHSIHFMDLEMNICQHRMVFRTHLYPKTKLHTLILVIVQYKCKGNTRQSIRPGFSWICCGRHWAVISDPLWQSFCGF